ncbi:MAG: hypothetical protein AAGD92_07495 [Pseudomonadota bacterium]
MWKYLLTIAGISALSTSALADDSELIDNGLTEVSLDGIAELRGKVSGRDDSSGYAVNPDLMRYDIDDGSGYFFSDRGAAAHPFVMYCGRNDEGVLEVRGWYAGEQDAAILLKSKLAAVIAMRGDCRVDAPGR